MISRMILGTYFTFQALYDILERLLALSEIASNCYTTAHVLPNLCFDSARMRIICVQEILQKNFTSADCGVTTFVNNNVTDTFANYIVSMYNNDVW